MCQGYLNGIRHGEANISPADAWGEHSKHSRPEDDDIGEHFQVHTQPSEGIEIK